MATTVMLGRPDAQQLKHIKKYYDSQKTIVIYNNDNKSGYDIEGVITTSLSSNFVNSKEAYIGNTVTGIEDGVFGTNTTLTAITLPKTITLTTNVFKGCAALTEINGNAFGSIIDGTSMFENNTTITEFTSDLDQMQVAPKMFKNASNLSTFTTTSLESLTDGKEMFQKCGKLTTFSCSMPNLINSVRMFSDCVELESFTGSTPNLKHNSEAIGGEYPKNGMFNRCAKLKSFNGNLINLETGFNMFFNCYALNSFNCVSLKNLVNGYQMFACQSLAELEDWGNLTMFKYDMLKLTEAESMFWGQHKLGYFNAKMPLLTNGTKMFLDCQGMTEFSSNITNLTHGEKMFWRCTSLSRFRSPLPNLVDGTEMFVDCKLDAESVEIILDSIPATGGTLHLGVSSEGYDAAKTIIKDSTLVDGGTGGTVSYNGWQITINVNS